LHGGLLEITLTVFMLNKKFYFKDFSVFI